MKKALTILFTTILVIGILAGKVNASSASISTSSKTVNVGNTVKITISFGEKVKMAEFDLSYDKSKFEFISSSKGAFGEKFSFVDSAAKADTGSVTLTFKAKAKGSANFKIYNLKLATETQRIANQPIGNASVSVTANEKKVTTTKKPTTSSSNKTNTTTTNKNDNQNTNTNTIQEVIEPEKPTQPAPDKLITLYEKGVTTIEENVYNIMIKALPAAISDEVRLEVNTIKMRNENYPKINSILSDVEGKKTYFDIKLIKDNEEVQPNGYVTVYIPIPKEYDNERIEIYYVDEENETFEPIEGTIQGEDYTFTTNHFSTYVLVEKPEPQVVEVSSDVENSVEKNVTQVVQAITNFFTNVKCLYILITVLVVIVLILLIIKTRRSKNN